MAPWIEEALALGLYHHVATENDFLLPREARPGPFRGHGSAEWAQVDERSGWRLLWGRPLGADPVALTAMKWWHKALARLADIPRIALERDQRQPASRLDTNLPQARR